MQHMLTCLHVAGRHPGGSNCNIALRALPDRLHNHVHRNFALGAHGLRLARVEIMPEGRVSGCACVWASLVCRGP